MWRWRRSTPGTMTSRALREGPIPSISSRPRACGWPTRALVDQLKPRVTVPMHYRGGSFGYDVTGPLEDYLELCGDVVRYPGNVLVLDKDTPGQTAVLTYCPQK